MFNSLCSSGAKEHDDECVVFLLSELKLWEGFLQNYALHFDLNAIKSEGPSNFSCQRVPQSRSHHQEHSLCDLSVLTI